METGSARYRRLSLMRKSLTTENIEVALHNAVQGNPQISATGLAKITETETFWNWSKMEIPILSLQRKDAHWLDYSRFNHGYVIICKLSDSQLNLRCLSHLRFGQMSHVITLLFTCSGNCAKLTCGPRDHSRVDEWRSSTKAGAHGRGFWSFMFALSSAGDVDVYWTVGNTESIGTDSTITID